METVITFEDLRTQLTYFALAYYKSERKDISNDASEWADDYFRKRLEMSPKGELELKDETPQPEEKKISVMDKARVVANLHTYSNYNLVAYQLEVIQADLREVFYQGYEFNQKELADLRTEHLKYKDAVEVLTYELNKASVERDKLKETLKGNVELLDNYNSLLQKFEADNERLKEINQMKSLDKYFTSEL